MFGAIIDLSCLLMNPRLLQVSEPKNAQERPGRQEVWIPALESLLAWILQSNARLASAHDGSRNTRGP